MVKSKDQVEKTIKTLIRQVSGEYRITEAILFGSYAHGFPRDESDIDVALISPDFTGKDEMEILQDLSRRAMKIDTSLEVVAFSPEELISPDPRSFSYQVKTSGVSIAVS